MKIGRVPGPAARAGVVALASKEYPAMNTLTSAQPYLQIVGGRDTHAFVNLSAQPEPFLSLVIITGTPPSSSHRKSQVIPKKNTSLPTKIANDEPKSGTSVRYPSGRRCEPTAGVSHQHGVRAVLSRQRQLCGSHGAGHHTIPPLSSST